MLKMYGSCIEAHPTLLVYMGRKGHGRMIYAMSATYI
ncbi:hypothetical protein X772_33035 [Mesorhizobium sp. LSJC280B00]|nr:hypothetical protein X772_33035 [Mesorhizobium sp. LSJC280B00]